MFPHYKDHDDILKDLNKHFKTAVLEKYTDCILNSFMQEANKKVIGSDYITRRISEGVTQKLHKVFLQKLRHRYGEWINVYDFNPRTLTFTTNFSDIYRTEHGRLYGYPPGYCLDHVFFTSHCFEQYEERTRGIPQDLVRLAFKRVRRTDPTAADILNLMFIKDANEFCETNKFIFVNVRTGILVIEKLDNLLIVKTYLTPDMDYVRSGWYENKIGSLELDRSGLLAPELVEFNKKRYIPLPATVDEQMDYQTYVDYLTGVK